MSLNLIHATASELEISSVIKVSDWSEYFGTHTKRDQMDYAISNVTVSSTGEKAKRIYQSKI